MLWMLWAWLGLTAFLLFFVVGRSREYGPLVLAYYFGMSLIHVPGVLAYIDPLSAPDNWEVTEIGFKVTLAALVAFIAGAWLFRRLGRKAAIRFRMQYTQQRSLNRLGWRMMGLGIFSYFVILPASKLLPSFTAVIASISTLLIIGLWLRLYSAVATSDFGRIATTFAMLPLLPVATLVTAGFIGYGVYWILAVITFYYVISRQKIWYYIAAPVIVFLGLSLFVTYMGERGNIREAVWQERASFGERLDRVAALITNFQFIDLEKGEHLVALDDRLNQNVFVGTGVRRYHEGAVDLKYGGTVPWWGVIPRAMWPEKPNVGGGTVVVGDFTGMTLAEGTSFGAGQVLELYANFAMPGVLIGFFIIGIALMWLDRNIMRAFAIGDLRGLLINAMPGLTLLQPGGNLIEIMVATVSSVIVARGVLFIERGRLPAAAPPTQPLRMAPRR